MRTSKGRGFLYYTALILFTAYVLLDTFVIPRSYAAVTDNSTGTVQQTAQSSSAADSSSGFQNAGAAGGSGDSSGSSAAVSTDTSYSAGGVSITLTTTRYCDTTVYVADITLSSTSSLKTALANDTYGKNITAATSAIASAHSAILAINGDYYGAQNSGYVIRNGVVYRSTASSSDQEDLVIGSDGSFSIIREGDVTAQELADSGAWQVLSFGPALLENSEITVGENSEVDKAKTSNPRTAIGEISPLHYVFVVADGRTSASGGLSLYHLAQFMESLNVTTAYNLDGGGSSTLYFNGAVVNNPTTNGRTISERKVSDIVYIG